MLQKKSHMRHMSQSYVRENITWNAHNLVFDSNINYNYLITKHRQVRLYFNFHNKKTIIFTSNVCKEPLQFILNLIRKKTILIKYCF